MVWDWLRKKKKYYHPLSILLEAGCIAGFVFGERKLKFWYASVLMAL
jgi:hypothetical protein